MLLFTEQRQGHLLWLIAKVAWHDKEERKCKTEGRTKTTDYEVPWPGADIEGSTIYK